jgi:hypothetical protein
VAPWFAPLLIQLLLPLDDLAVAGSALERRQTLWRAPLRGAPRASPARRRERRRRTDEAAEHEGGEAAPPVLAVHAAILGGPP